MFITRQDILSTGAGVVVCENEDYYYMVKEITEGFAIERKLSLARVVEESWILDAARYYCDCTYGGYIYFDIFTKTIKTADRYK